MSPQPSPGDFTGQTKKALAKEATQEQRDRRAEMSMMSQEEEEGQRDGVWDGRSGERLDNQEAVVVDSFPENGGSFYGREPEVPQEPIFTGKETEEEMVPHLASRSSSPPAPQILLRKPFVKVRVNNDVEKMTYGMLNGEPNNYDFKEGFVYEVPVEVAEHLNERNLVAQWVP